FESSLRYVVDMDIAAAAVRMAARASPTSCAACTAVIWVSTPAFLGIAVPFG
ncbi:MAG: hypothetical protein QOH29_1610, partial [Actinomycetota bacterium]|nr:hypothetical protein [Actinomycetota bacterium]